MLTGEVAPSMISRGAKGGVLAFQQADHGGRLGAHEMHGSLTRFLRLIEKPQPRIKVSVIAL